MLQTTAISLVIGFWASLYLVDSFLKTHRKMAAPYIDFMSSCGLSVHIGQLRWYSTSMNRAFVRLGSVKPRLLRAWFTVGVVFGAVVMVLSVTLLSMIIINTFRHQPVEQQVLMPVMPGVNLPMNQLGYYLLTLFVCGIFHELGHAIAAVREQVRVNGFGVFVLALYPGAFVDLSTDQLQCIDPLRQLRIYCAGVWHNFVIVIIAICALLTMPTMLAPFYMTGDAVLITNVVPNSPVSGARGLVIGDQVTHIDACRVTSSDDWMSCVRAGLASDHGSGFCVAMETVQQQDVSTSVSETVSGVVECCSNSSNTHLCFQYHTKKSANLSYACLPARSTSDRPACRLQSDCSFHRSTQSVCVVPSLDNSTRLLRVIRHGKQPLLFLGHPLDLYYSVTVNNYVPKSTMMPIHLPYVLETFCKYLISLSGALAILNVVPCYALDGQWILLAFVELALCRTVPVHETRLRIYSAVLLAGTLLLAANVIIALWMLFIR